jgi:hypothetical protein
MARIHPTLCNTAIKKVTQVLIPFGNICNALIEIVPVLARADLNVEVTLESVSAAGCIEGKSGAVCSTL